MPRYFNPTTNVIFGSDEAQDAPIRAVTDAEIPDLIAAGATVDASADYTAGNAAAGQADASAPGSDAAPTDAGTPGDAPPEPVAMLFYNPETKVLFGSTEAQPDAMLLTTRDDVPGLLANGATVDDTARPLLPASFPPIAPNADVSAAGTLLPPDAALSADAVGANTSQVAEIPNGATAAGEMSANGTSSSAGNASPGAVIEGSDATGSGLIADHTHVAGSAMSSSVVAIDADHPAVPVLNEIAAIVAPLHASGDSLLARIAADIHRLVQLAKAEIAKL